MNESEKQEGSDSITSIQVAFKVIHLHLQRLICIAFHKARPSLRPCLFSPACACACVCIQVEDELISNGTGI